MKTEKCKMAFLFTALFLLVNVLSFAQEEDIKNVRLKVVKNNETTLDTSFVMDTDKEALHKKIHELTGIEMKLFTGFDLKHSKHGYKYMVFFDEDKECEDLDSLMAKKEKLAAVHKEMFDEMEIEIDEDDFVWIGKDAGVIMVIEDDDTVKIKKHKKIVKPGEETEVKIMKKGDHEFIIIDEEGEKRIEKDKDGNYFIKKTKSGEEGEHVIMKKKGGNVFIISDDEAHHHDSVFVTKGDKKKTYVITKEHKSGEEIHSIVKKDMEFINHEGKLIKIIVEDDENGTIIEKKINIMKIKEEGEEIEVIIEIEEVIKKKKEKKAKP